MTTLCEKAYAKLNLSLDVLCRREDGFHDLKSVMQTVSLHDTVELTVGTGQPWKLICGREDIPCDERNIAWKAASFTAMPSERILRVLPSGLKKTFPPVQVWAAAALTARRFCGH